MSSKPLRIAICGAGVAGAIVAHLLADEPNVEVICLERASPDDHSDAGTGLNVGPNALKALAAADPALAERLQADGVSLPWKSWRTTLTDGTELMNLPLSRVADNDGIRIRWSELYRQLRAPALERILFKQTVTAMDYQDAAADARITLTFQGPDGATQRLDDIDLLIGADGRYSMVRERFLGKPRPQPLGVVIFRLLVEDTSGGLIDDYEQWFNGPHRLLAFRVPGNGLYIAGSFPIEPESPIADDVKSAEYLRAIYTPAGKPPSDQAKYLIDSICSHVEQIHWARIADIHPAFADGRGRVLLLGDAAHAMVPTLGQGATSAIEDACVAGAHIAAALRAGGTVDVPALCRRIEADRMDRVRFVVGFSREASDSMLPGADPAPLTLKKTQPPFLAKLSRLYRDAPYLDAPVSERKLAMA